MSLYGKSGRGGPTTWAHFIAVNRAHEANKKARFHNAMNRYRVRMLEHPSSLEIKLADILNDLRIPFIRQEIIGRYIVDFRVKMHGLKKIIEADGPMHNTPRQRHLDAKRDKFLKHMGYEVLHVPCALFGSEDMLIGTINDFVFDNDRDTSRAQPGLKALDERSVSGLNPVNPGAAKVNASFRTR